MGNLGLGVMIGILGGNEETVKALNESIGKEISLIELLKDSNGWDADSLIFTFNDGTKLRVWDGGQSCCESRYMHTDDDLQAFTESELTMIEIRDAPDIEDEYGEAHEVQFLLVTTGKGVFTIETHNEHNGYYGGFWIQCALVEDSN